MRANPGAPARASEQFFVAFGGVRHTAPHYMVSCFAGQIGVSAPDKLLRVVE